jgi:DNA-binding MarR family transcriptional regulator
VNRTRDVPPFPLGRALEFLQRLWRLDQALERLSSRMEQSVGITSQQQLIVRCVGRFPGMTAGQLAGLLHVDPGTISAALGRLEAKDLIARRKDPSDNRRVALGLTVKGRALDAATAETVEQAAEELLASTPASELAQALSVIDRFTTLMHASRFPSTLANRASAALQIAKRRPPRAPAAPRERTKRLRRPRGAPAS